MAKIKINIEDLPEGMEINEEELKKVIGGITLSPISFKPIVTRPGITKPVSPIAIDMDCWSYTASRTNPLLNKI